MNRTANVAAADRMVAACMRLRSVREAWWTRSESAFTPMFAEDLPFVRGIFLSLGDEPCAEVEPRLRAPFVVGGLETWQGTPWPPERLEELRAVIGRARTRCVPLMIDLLGSLDEIDGSADEDVEAMATEGCDDMTSTLDGYGALDREALDPIALSAWPEQIEAMATALESVGE